MTLITYLPPRWMRMTQLHVNRDECPLACCPVCHGQRHEQRGQPRTAARRPPSQRGFAQQGDLRVDVCDRSHGRAKFLSILPIPWSFLTADPIAQPSLLHSNLLPVSILARPRFSSAEVRDILCVVHRRGGTRLPRGKSSNDAGCAGQSPCGNKGYSRHRTSSNPGMMQ